MKKYNYVYIVFEIPTDRYYIGARSSDIEPEVDITKYRTSSTDKNFKQRQISNPEEYLYFIIETFVDRESAIEYEIFLHEKFDVAKNEKFINKAKQTSSGFDQSGIIFSKETRKRISEGHRNPSDETRYKNGSAFRGKNLPPEHRQKISNSLKGKQKSKEHLEKLRQANLGKVLSQETKNKMSNVRKGKRLGTDNPMAREIIIYDLLGEIVAQGAMYETLVDVGLPKNACKYIDSCRVYSDITNQGIFKRIHNQGRSKFCGYKLVSV